MIGAWFRAPKAPEWMTTREGTRLRWISVWTLLVGTEWFLIREDGTVFGHEVWQMHSGLWFWNGKRYLTAEHAKRAVEEAAGVKR